MILVPMYPDTATDEEIFSAEFYQCSDGLFEELGITEGLVDCAVDNVEESFTLKSFGECSFRWG